MSQLALKRAVALAAVEEIRPHSVLGVGTGSTVNCVLEALVSQGITLKAAVASSEETAVRLRAMNVEVVSLNQTGTLALYVDGADEVSPNRYCNKGGGGALTGEKIIAQASRTFLCLVDESKCVEILGQAHPVVIEVLAGARSLVARECVKLGGQPVYREGCVTDEGNALLDVYGLSCLEPLAMEQAINMIPGVVTNGLFVSRPADRVLVGTQNQGVYEL